MSDDNTSSWSLDLDSSEAQSSIGTLQAGLDAVGATDFSELTSAITEIGTVVGVVGLAVLAIKEAFSLVFDAEEIEAVNQQFNVLAANAGVVGSSLKTALEESSGGLVDETTLLQGANKAMVMLGDNTYRLPEIMTLARQATAVMGGDLMTNFNNIAKAISTGNERQLKSLGLAVDSKAAYDDYAKSLGLTSDELSDTGKQTAMLNAVVEKGATAYQGQNVNIKEATDSWLTLKSTMKDVGDSIALAFNKIWGQGARDGLAWLSSAASSVKTFLVDHLGSGADQAAAHLSRLNDALTNAKVRLIDLEQKKIHGIIASSPEYDIEHAQLTKLVNDYQKQLDATKGSVRQLAAVDSAASAQSIAAAKAKVDAEAANSKQVADDRKKLNKELADLQKKNADGELKASTSVVQVNKAADAKILAAKKKLAADIAALDDKAGMTAKTKAKMTVALQQQEAQDVTAINAQRYGDEQKALTNLENQNGTVTQKVGNAWAAESGKAQLKMQDFTSIAVGSFTTVQSQAVSAFEAMGNGSKSAGDAMKGFMYGSLGSIAESAGTVMLAEGVWPPNPLALAGGAALITLGSFLKSQSNGSSGPSVPASSAPGGSSSSTTPAPSASVASSAPASASAGPSASTQAQQSVNFVVQGNLYNSNEAKLEMMDIMRSATDATAFQYTQVGGGSN